MPSPLGNSPVVTGLDPVIHAQVQNIKDRDEQTSGGS
jgi:hypothetical protein